MSASVEQRRSRSAGGSLLSLVAWTILTGAGVYMAYTPFNAMLFDRIIATTREVGTAGFLIYLADASGYAGTVGLLLFRNFGAVNLDWVSFFETIAYATTIVYVGGALLSALHFFRARTNTVLGAPMRAGSSA